MERELKRLVLREGFWVQAGGWHSDLFRYSKSTLPSVTRLRAGLEQAPGNAWAGFLLYFPMDEDTVRGTSGTDLVEAMLAIYEEVTPAMRLCTQTPL